MGLALSCLTSCCTQLACCFTQSACSLCCSSLPAARSSTTTRIGYALTLAISTIISYIIKTEKFAHFMSKIKPLCGYLETELCEKFVGYEAVYRIGLTMFAFFMTMCVIMINVRSTKDWRSYLQNGFWIIKLTILILYVVGFTFISTSQSFNKGMFDLGMSATFIYLIIQLIIVIDFVHEWNQKWLTLAEDEHNCWFGALFSLSFFMTAISLTMIVIMFVYFRGDLPCHGHKSIISFHLLFCILMFVLSVNNRVREMQPNSGIFQASAITLYTTIQLFLALTFWSHDCNSIYGVNSSTGAWASVHEIISLIFTLILIVINAVSNSDSEKAQLLGITTSEVRGGYGTSGGIVGTGSEQMNRAGQIVFDDEEEGVCYSYSLFHFILALASLYLMLIITNWKLPDLNPNNPNVTAKIQQFSTPSIAPASSEEEKTAALVKIINSFLCIMIYIWTLVAPIVLPNRDFGYF